MDGDILFERIKLNFCFTLFKIKLNSRWIMAEKNWFKKFRFLIFVVIISGSLNIFFIFYFIYFLQEKHTIDLEITPTKTSVKAKEISNCDYLAFISKFSFRELLSLLSNKQLVEEGFCKRDLALGILVLNFDFNIERALLNQNLQVRKASFIKKMENISSQVEVTLFAGLLDHHFESIIHYALSEKWPFSAKGLFNRLKKWEKPRDVTLEKAFELTDEFYKISNIFTGIKQEELLDLLCQLSWPYIEQFLQLKNIDIGNARTQFLVGAVEQNSSIAANLLIKLDFIYAIKKLSDNHIFKILSLAEKNKDLEQFCVELLKSSRSDLIWRKSAALLYEISKEKVPEKFDKKEVMRKFVLSDDLKNRWQKEEKKACALSSIIQAKEEKKNIHIVQEGENLWKIARRYKIDIDLLMKVNNLDKDKIRPGKPIIIPKN